MSKLRILLSYHPGVRKDLRDVGHKEPHDTVPLTCFGNPSFFNVPLSQMLWNIDQGKAADISGIMDEGLKSSVKKLLKLLGLRRGREVNYEYHLWITGIYIYAFTSCIPGVMLIITMTLLSSFTTSTLYVAWKCA